MTSTEALVRIDSFPWLRWWTAWAVVGVLVLFMPVQLEIWTSGTA